MTGTAITVKNATKNIISKKEAALIERFTETVKIEVNEDGKLHLDGTKTKALKKFQKDKLKNTLSIVVPVTITTIGTALITLSPSVISFLSSSSTATVFWFLAFGVAIPATITGIGGLFLYFKRGETRNNFIVKNSESVVEKFLLERGIAVNRENLTSVTKSIVGILVQKWKNPGEAIYHTTDGNKFRLQIIENDITIEYIEKAVSAIKQKVLESTTQLPSNIAVIDQIRNKTLQLCTQQLSAEQAYTFAKAQKDTQKAIKLAQELQALGDSNWKTALNASLQLINTELETLIEECRNEKRRQLTSIRS